LASLTRPVLTATILAHLIRCLYYRKGECVAKGSVKSTWVAEVFGVNARNVKAARQYLVSIGWLTTLESPHWHRQRYGKTAVLNLTWGNARTAKERRPESPPRAVLSTTELPPPESHKELPSEYTNQKLTSRERSGGLRPKRGGEGPSLRNVTLNDLSLFSRTEALYREALRAKLLTHSESNVLNWIGAAVRARSVGCDPVRVFLGIVKKGLWHHITLTDEDRARRALHHYRDKNPGLFRPEHWGEAPGRRAPDPRIGGIVGRLTGRAA
jgi:hypothetical protein